MTRRAPLRNVIDFVSIRSKIIGEAIAKIGSIHYFCNSPGLRGEDGRQGTRRRAEERERIVDKNRLSLEVTQQHEDDPPGGDQPPKKQRKSGKAKGWLYLRTAADAKLALNRVLNLVLVGDTKAVDENGERLRNPPKLDPQAANAATNAIRTWLSAHDETLEDRMEEFEKTNQMLGELLERRKAEVPGNGSRSQ